MNELWHPVPGYEGLYEVSDQGNVRSLNRIVVQLTRWGEHRERRLRGKLLRQGRAVNNRRQVCLSLDNKQRVFYVHTLVALAFHGPRPEGLEIDHINGDYLDNRAVNLGYVTHQENQRRGYKLGLINPPRSTKVHTQRPVAA